MKGLVFDVDGLLADTETLVALASIDMFAELYGLTDVRVEDFRPFIGTGPHRYVEGVAEKYGVTIDTEAAVESRHRHFVRRIEAGAYIGFPGARTLVDAAAAAPGWRLAIATSSLRHKAEISLKAAGIPIEAFNAFISGDMVTRRKPAPDIYIKAAEALAIEPAGCVGVEDAIAGVQSVRGAGMACLAVTNSFSREELAEADLVVSSLEEVSLETLDDLLDSRPGQSA